MIFELRVDRGRDRHHAARPDEQRVAVGRLARDILSGRAAAGRGAVFDHQLLAEDLAELGADQSRENVVAATGRERDDQTDRLVGIVRRIILRLRRLQADADGKRYGGAGQSAKKANRLHGRTPPKLRSLVALLIIGLSLPAPPKYG